jgi:Tol biopolymer transport system component
LYRVGSTASDDLFSVSIQRPGTAQRLNESGESVDDFLISPDSARVAYLLSETDGGSADGLYSVPIGGGARTRLDDGGTVHPFRFTPDARRVIYVTERDGEGLVEELLGVPSDGGTAPVKLYEPPDGGFVYDDVTSFQFAALGTHGTFVVELRDDDLEELYGVQLEPRSRPTLLATVPRLEASPGSPSAVLISPDEEWVAYTMREGGDGGGYYWLFGVPMDGSRAPVQLNPGPVAGVRLGPDGRTLFYFLTGGATGLYRVPVDSSEPKQELTGWTLDDTSLPFELSVDGSTLVVLADALVDGERELFSLPSDGSSPPVQLNDVTAPTASRAYDFQITADGTRVIYALGTRSWARPWSSSAFRSTRARLPCASPDRSPPARESRASCTFRSRTASCISPAILTPATGSGACPRTAAQPPVPLHAELPVDANAPTYRVVSAGTQVVFRADLAANDVYELFVAPIDGSAPPRRLNGTLVAGGDVHQAFEIDGTGTRVVYRADEKQDEVFELFSASLVAPAVPVQLTGPHVAGGDVVGFHTVPGGRHVVFTADHDTDDVFELYIAPVDQVKQARKLSGALVAGGDVQPSFSVEPGGNVVYIADQDEDSVNEVYLSSPTFPRASASGAMPRTPR